MENIGKEIKYAWWSTLDHWKGFTTFKRETAKAVFWMCVPFFGTWLFEVAMRIQGKVFG